MPGARKPVQQQQCWSVWPASFAIENLEAAYIGGAITNLLHQNVLSIFPPYSPSMACLKRIVAQRKDRAIARPRRPSPQRGGCVGHNQVGASLFLSKNASRNHRPSTADAQTPHLSS